MQRYVVIVMCLIHCQQTDPFWKVHFDIPGGCASNENVVGQLYRLPVYLPCRSFYLFVRSQLVSSLLNEVRRHVVALSFQLLSLRLSDHWRRCDLLLNL